MTESDYYIVNTDTLRLATSASSLKKQNGENQDRCYIDGDIFPHSVEETSRSYLTEMVTDIPYVYAICDGMGGGFDGKYAAELVVNALRESLCNALTNNFSHNCVLVQTFCEHMSESLISYAKSELESYTGTTLVMAVFIDNKVQLFNIGDSRAYLCRYGEAEQLSIDDTPEKEPSDEDYSDRCLTSFIGASVENISVHCVEKEISRGDRIILCSDGVIRGVSSKKSLLNCVDISSEPPQMAAFRLTDAALEGGSKDDITAIVITVQ